MVLKVCKSQLSGSACVFIFLVYTGCMSKAVCTECHYIFDSRLGIEELEIAPGTPFEYVNEAIFACPHCNASKDQFVEVVEEVMEVSDLDDLTDMESEHVPVYRVVDDELLITMGLNGAEHPQEAGHFIEWIEVIDASGDLIDRTYFSPEDSPVARFPVDLEDV